MVCVWRDGGLAHEFFDGSLAATHIKEGAGEDQDSDGSNYDAGLKGRLVSD